MKIESKGKIEEKTGKNGKPYYTAGLKINGQWHNGFLNKDDIARYEKLTDVATGIELYSEEFNGKTYQKFKFINEKDARLLALENAVKVLHERLDNLEGGGI
jgi:hypothetical protein